MSWQPVDTVDQIVQEVFSPPLNKLRFEQIERRKWVRSKKPLIREVVQLIAMKGACFSPIWGFSLDFVPHISAGRVRWHRTAKSTRLDLSYDPYDYDERPCKICQFQSVEGMRITTAKLSDEVVTSSSEFFGPVRTVADLPRAFEEKLKRPTLRFGFLNYIQHPMAYAFVLAKCGRPRKARKWLDIAKKYHELDEIELDKLALAFEAVQSKH